MTTQKIFFVNHTVSIFSLIRTACFTSYKIIVRLLAWHTKFENRKESRWNFCMSDDNKKV